MKKIKSILDKNPIVVILLVLVTIAGLLVWGARVRGASTEESVTSAEVQVPTPQAQGTATMTASGTDKLLLGMQDILEKQHGTPPEGFVWDRTGKPLSLGYRDMSSEDVVFSYLRALSTLDTGMAERLSRNSSVISTYYDYFDTTRSAGQTSSDVFKRESFKTALLSLEVTGIENSSVFAGDKRVYTVNGRIVDFKNVDFWEKEKEELFSTMYKYDVEQRDFARAESYVSDYVANFYTSEEAPKRNVTFTLTVEKYADIDSGYLVSIDKDLKDILTNSTGLGSRTKSVSEYIMDGYRDYKIERNAEKVK